VVFLFHDLFEVACRSVESFHGGAPRATENYGVRTVVLAYSPFMVLSMLKGRMEADVRRSRR